MGTITMKPNCKRGDNPFIDALLDDAGRRESSGKSAVYQLITYDDERTTDKV